MDNKNLSVCMIAVFERDPSDGRLRVYVRDNASVPETGKRRRPTSSAKGLAVDLIHAIQDRTAQIINEDFGGPWG